jgi:DNA polymerase-2
MTPEHGYLLHAFQKEDRGRTVLTCLGRMESGDTFSFTSSVKPHFYVRTSDVEAVRESATTTPGFETISAPYRTMDNARVSCISTDRSRDLAALSEQLQGRGIRTYESDLSPERRFLLSEDLGRIFSISGSWHKKEGVDRHYDIPELAPADTDWQPNLSVTSLDIETNEREEIYAISLVTYQTDSQDTRLESVHIIGSDSQGIVVAHKDEKNLLGAFAEELRHTDPDIITGWNVIDFDLPALRQRFRRTGLRFRLGRTRDESWIRQGERWGGSQATIHGRQVLDTMHLIRSTQHRFEDYRLGTVSQSILGRGKTLEADQQQNMQQVLLNTYASDPDALAEYCLEDSRLVADLLKEERLMGLYLKKSILTGLSLERSTGNIAAFDSLYIRALHKRGMVAPAVGVDRATTGSAPGGLVLEPLAGLYKNILVFDFKSLYPSIIRTFNIDPVGYVAAGEVDPRRDYIEAPNGARFERTPGILPSILEELWKSREIAKSENDEVGSYSYKILMNSFYGVLATGACRFANPKVAGAITEHGHRLLKWTRDLLSTRNLRVIYGDTDSLFIDPGFHDDVDAEFAMKEGTEICAWINQELAQLVEKEYRLPSKLELEFEKLFRRFFLPYSRGEELKGRAKGYAGLLHAPAGERLEITGMEAVRSDWTDLAHDAQRDLLEMIFHDVSSDTIEDHIWALVNSVRKGEKDGELVYRKRLRKPVDDYTKSLPPHVKAAKLLPNPSGTISYLITRDGPQPVGYVTSPIDYSHYVEKQISPIVNSVARVSDLDTNSALHGAPALFTR